MMNLSQNGLYMVNAFSNFETFKNTTSAELQCVLLHFWSKLTCIKQAPTSVNCIAICAIYYSLFVDRGKLLTSRLLSQGYRREKLVSIVKHFYGRLKALLIFTM